MYFWATFLRVTLDKNIDESQFTSENAGVKITDADSVYLLTVSERTYDMGDINTFDKQKDFKLVDDCVSTLFLVPPDVIIYVTVA